MWSTCLRTSCSKAVRHTLGGGLRDCRSCFGCAVDLGRTDELHLYNRTWKMKCSLTARAIFSGSFLGQFLGLQFQAMRTTGSGPTSEQGVLCPQSSLYLSTLSLSLFLLFFLHGWENDVQHFQTWDPCSRPCPYIDHHRPLSKEVWKSNFRQHGQMKSRDGKRQREEKSRREQIREEKESEERRCRCAKR